MPLILLDAVGIGRVHLPFQRKLLVAPRTPQDFQLCHPVFQFHLLCQHGVIRGGRLKLRGGKHRFIHILTGPGDAPAGENLLDIPQLLFLNLPEVGVKGALCHKLLYHDLRVLVALPDPAPIPLGNIGGPPGTIQMIDRNYLVLHIHAGSQLIGAAQQDADFTLTGALKQRLPLDLGRGVVDKGDLGFRYALFDQHPLKFIIYIETPRLGRTHITENELGGGCLGGVRPNLIHLVNADVQFASCTVCRGDDHAGVNRHHAGLAGQLQHIIFFRLYTASADCVRPQDKLRHDRPLRGGGLCGNDLRLSAPNGWQTGNIKHIRSFDVRNLSENRHQFRQVVEPHKAIPHPVAAALRPQLKHGSPLGEVGDPGIEIGPAEPLQLLRL